MGRPSARLDCTERSVQYRIEVIHSARSQRSRVTQDEVMALKAPDRQPARDRLLAAADELFYSEGVHVVGVDRIVKRAGVTKASLYNTFGSKEELVRAYLEAHTLRRQMSINRILAASATRRRRILH